MTFSDAMFWVFAAVSVVPALFILLSREIVRMAFWLLASLSGFAGLYLQLGAGFLGFAQVVVYIGGILILLLFGVMLTQKQDVPVRGRWGPALLVPGVIAGLLVLAGLLFIALGTGWRAESPGPPGYTAPAIGYDLLSDYVLPFEVVSVLLVAAMVGATYIARRKDEPAAAPGPGSGPAASPPGGEP
jgi:NADH-quinone oxidoreductase subunit J